VFLVALSCGGPKDRIPHVNQAAANEQRLVWSLWAAVALAVIGGLMPFVFGGTSSRVTSALVPFVVGAVAIAACAVVHAQSRTFAAILFFVGGLAIMFGLLTMFSLPVRLAVLGTCPAVPAPCPTGLPRPLTDGENTGMGAAAAFGLLAVFLGFYGLVTLFRRPVVEPAAPPMRRVPQVPIPAAAAPAAAAPAIAPPVPAATEPTKAESEPAVEEEPELPAHEEEELPELPPHESTSPTT
jgi:hypothetical protein